ncbi:MAG: trypsin-like peptidase domain-containing protein [Nocardioidaceae bacterium]
MSDTGEHPDHGPDATRPDHEGPAPSGPAAASPWIPPDGGATTRRDPKHLADSRTQPLGPMPLGPPPPGLVPGAGGPAPRWSPPAGPGRPPRPSEPPAGWTETRSPSGPPAAAPTVPPPTQPLRSTVPGPGAFGASAQPTRWMQQPPAHLAAPTRTGRPPGWIWPAVASLALVIGLLGGALGGVAYDALTDGDQATDTTGTDPTGTNADDSPGNAPLPAGNTSVSAVAARLLPSTVQVIASYQGQAGGATGSGFVLDRQGHVVTNNHVVADSADNDQPIEVVDEDGNHHDAELVGRSPVYDLAVLQVDDAEGLRPAALGASRRLRVGDEVVAIGSPLGLTSTVTAGIVSAVDRPVTTGDSADDTSYINAVQTDAAINPGNSGGPLVNLRGQVVGVNSAIATTGQATGQSGSIGVGFAIPIEQVRVTTDQILRDGEARYPVIGATVQTQVSDDEGARIDEVPTGTPAAAAGLRSDDLVVAINGQRVTDGIALIVAIRTHQPGETVTLTVERDGDQRTVEVTLDSKVG